MAREIEDFAVLSEFLGVVFAPKSNNYSFAQLSMEKPEDGNILVFHYRKRITINGSGLTKNCFGGVYGAELVTKPQSKEWKDPFMGVSVWDYKPGMPVTKITYPEIQREHFDLVLSKVAKALFKKGFNLDSLVIAKDAESVGHPMGDIGEKVSRFYVLYDRSFGFSDEYPAIAICGKIPNKEQIRSFAEQKDICVHE